MAQLGGIVMIDPADAAQQNNFFFGGVDNCRWRKPVVPGDVLVRWARRAALGEAKLWRSLGGTEPREEGLLLPYMESPCYG